MSLKLMAAFICLALLAFGNVSCENKTKKDATQNTDEQITGLPDGSQNDEDHIESIKKQAEKGDAEAQCKLGILYANGQEGMPQSYEEAKSWYLKSAKQGYSPAQYNLSTLYFREENYSEAFKWMKKCAESEEYPYAQYILGDFYLNGIGCSPDIEKGLFWLDKAAEQGVEDAIEELNEIREEISNY